MHGPAKTASLEIGFEGSNPSFHATVGLLTMYPMNELVRLLREPKAIIGSSPALKYVPLVYRIRFAATNR